MKEKPFFQPNYTIIVYTLGYYWIGRLIGYFGINSSLRQFFSLYQAVSEREGETNGVRKSILP